MIESMNQWMNKKMKGLALYGVLRPVCLGSFLFTYVNRLLLPYDYGNRLFKTCYTKEGI